MSYYISDFFPDPSLFPITVSGFIQVLLLLIFYFMLLVIGSILLVEGSELLLLIPSWAPFVGSIVLPVLSAIPEASLVFFAGTTQSDLDVAIGTLSGSVITTLTIPWFIAIYAGRVDIVNGHPAYFQYPKLTYYGIDLTQVGIGIPKAMNFSSVLMVASVLPYMLIQISGLIYYNDSTKVIADEERPWSLAAGLLCLVIGIGYLVSQYLHSVSPIEPDDLETRITERLILAIKNRQVTLLGIYINELYPRHALPQQNFNTNVSLFNNPMHRESGEAEELIYHPQPVEYAAQSNTMPENFRRKLKSIASHFYDARNRSSQENIKVSDLPSLFRDMGEDVSLRQMKKLYSNIIHPEGAGGGSPELSPMPSFYLESGLPSGTHQTSTESVVEDIVDFQTFFNILLAYTNKKGYEFTYQQSGGHDVNVEQQSAVVDEIESTLRRQRESSIEELSSPGNSTDIPTPYTTPHIMIRNDYIVEAEIPDDLKHLSPDEQQFYIRWRAAWILLLGVLIVVIISDPMVTVIEEIAKRIGIKTFYVAFVLGPLASIAPEFIASYNYAAQKTLPSIGVALSTLQGSVIMNNTFVLSIFLFMVYAYTLEWEYFSETLSTLVVVLLMVIYGWKSVNTVLDGLVILFLYPASIALVVLLQYLGY